MIMPPARSGMMLGVAIFASGLRTPFARSGPVPLALAVAAVALLAGCGGPASGPAGA
jgi:hypothetical protein